MRECYLDRSLDDMERNPGRLRSKQVLLIRTAFLVAMLLGGRIETASAKEPSSQQIQDAMARTGMTREELIRLYQEGNLPQFEDSLGQAATPPGRTELPQGIPVVVLPSGSRPSEPIRPESIGTTPGDRTPAGNVLFGHDFFRLQPGLFSQSAFGPVPEDYVIGTGDQVVIETWGDVELHLERIVDRDGTILLPKGGKILCSGRTLADLKDAVRERLARSYSGIGATPDEGSTHLDVSLGKLRAIRVFVIGEVTQPGAYELSSVATIFTALYAAGGPSSSGSMREIRLVRGDQVVAHLDVYDYLLAGERKNDVVLHEYDTVFIPPRGKTTQLVGSVNRPMMFELNAAENLSDLLRFGAGFTPDAATEILHVERIVPPAERRPGEPDKTQIDIPLDPQTGLPKEANQSGLCDGDVVHVGVIAERTGNWVEIQGAIKRPGRYQFSEGMDVASLVDQAGKTWPEVLVERATIDRVDADGSYKSFDFPLGDVLNGKGETILLRPMDQLRVFSKWELQDRYSVSISGEVRQPGSFAYREGMTLRDLILRGGGLLESADRIRVQVSRVRREALENRDLSQAPAEMVDLIDVSLGADFLTGDNSFLLMPHDRVAVRNLPWWEQPKSVTLRGEVFYPGVYTLEGPGDRLSDVIRRANGLKPTAFPAGARVSRSKDSIGNVAIDLGCALRSPRTSCDLILYDGDEVIIPETPQTVKVTGAVGYPTSIAYTEGRKPGYYVDRAGGWTEGADKKRTLVVYPNGMSRPVRRLMPDPKVLPGSTIVVPYQTPGQKPDRLANMEKIIGILSSLAVTYLVIDRTAR